jgi:hypothetical protein
MRHVDHPEAFGGLPVQTFDPEAGGRPDGTVAWRLEVEYDDGPDEFGQLLDAFLGALDASGVTAASGITALLVGQWGGAAYEEKLPVTLLAEKLAPLPNLRALFLGDMIPEECEISWIQHDDVTPLLEALPALEILTVRGGEGLQLRPVRHENLRELTFESGGLPADVIRAVGASDLPKVWHLELWLGTENYGGNATVADLSDILAGSRLPALTSLGLQNSEIVDDVAGAVAGAPVVARLTSLDLSMGVLTDRGARALLAGQPLTHLDELVLAHHYLSVEMMERLRAELPGVEVDLDEQLHDDEDDRWIAVSE